MRPRAGLCPAAVTPEAAPGSVYVQEMLLRGTEGGGSGGAVGGEWRSLSAYGGGTPSGYGKSSGFISTCVGRIGV